MSGLRISKWWGLYALLPLMIALMIVDIGADMSPMWHSILFVAITVAIGVLALSWVDRHPRLVERSGAGLSCNDENPPAPCYTRRFYPAFEDRCWPAPIRHDGATEQE